MLERSNDELSRPGRKRLQLPGWLGRAGVPQDAAVMAGRLSLAACFLSAVADRLGMWGGPGAPGVAWGSYSSFLEYTRQLMPILPASVAHALGGVATCLELLLSGMLLLGWRVRLAALGSAALLSCFALSMSLSLGLKPALDYSVWSAAAAALLLSSVAQRGKR